MPPASCTSKWWSKWRSSPGAHFAKMLFCVLLFWSGWLRGLYEKRLFPNKNQQVSFWSKIWELNEQGMSGNLIVEPLGPQNFWAKTSSCSCQSQIQGSIIFKQNVKKPSLQIICSWILDNFCRKVRFLLPTCQISIPFDSVFYLEDLVNMNRSITWDNRFTIADYGPSDSHCEESQGHDQPMWLFFSPLRWRWHTPFKSMTYDQQHHNVHWQSGHYHPCPGAGTGMLQTLLMLGKSLKG